MIDTCESDPLSVAEGYHFLALTYKREPAENKQYLESALQVIDSLQLGEQEENKAVHLLKTRILDSYARHFIYSQEVTYSSDYKDRIGEAIAYGAYGAYHLDFRKDYEKALEFYEKDEKLSEDIGNIDGIRTSASRAGQCYESLHDYRKALEKFQRAYRLQESALDHFFAIIGLMINNILLKDYNETQIDQWAEELESVIESAGSNERKPYDKDRLKELRDTISQHAQDLTNKE